MCSRNCDRRRALPFVLGAIAAVPVPIVAQDVPLRMQPVEEYLLDEEYEVALALSAGPDYVTGGAAVLAFEPDGYREVRPGSNGFTCLVERSWSSPIGLHVDFFNPSLRAPICFNAEASRSILQEYLRRTELAMEGKTISEIRAVTLEDLATGRLRAPEALAMSFMLSDAQRLGTETGRFKPHLMFYVPYASYEDLGSPPIGCSHACIFEHGGGPFAALIVPVAAFEPGPPVGGR